MRWALPAGEAAPGAAAEPLRCSRFVVAVGHNAAGRRSSGGGRGVSRTGLQPSWVSGSPGLFVSLEVFPCVMAGSSVQAGVYK